MEKEEPMDASDLCFTKRTVETHEMFPKNHKPINISTGS